MSTDSALIDRIVYGVLNQLAGEEAVRAGENSPAGERKSCGSKKQIEISDRIVTADVLAKRIDGATQIAVSPRAIVTPAAWDLVRDRGLTVVRATAKPQASDAHQRTAATESSPSALRPVLVVVRNTPEVDRLWDDLKTVWRRELLGCPDDAAKLGISAISRGETTCVVILAGQSHRAACLANRNAAVNAVAVRDATDIPAVRKQLRANVWCVDPGAKTWFELRNLLRAIERR